MNRYRCLRRIRKSKWLSILCSHAILHDTVPLTVPTSEPFLWDQYIERTISQKPNEWYGMQRKCIVI